LFWGRELQARFEVRFAPYNQILQTLLDPASLCSTNRHGVNVLLLRRADLGGLDVAELTRTIQGAAARAVVPLIAVACPDPPNEGNAGNAAANDAAWGDALTALRDAAPGLQVITAADIERLYPVAAWYDAAGDAVGKIPYTESYYAALATMLARQAHALTAPPFKAIAVDCDNTLWSGVCGEDGAENVVLDEPRRALHEFLLRQRDAGMLLCLASKNNEADVWETFAAHPEFPLRPRHFAAWRLNWDSKAANVAALAGELNIGADSFLFLDDNARETDEVAGALPGVLALTLPEETATLKAWLDHIWAFDHPVVTEEDRRRNASIEQTREFGRELHAATNLTEFLAGLKLRVDVAPLTNERLSRAAQLTQRTNQFNCSTVRRTEAELQALLQDERYEIYGAEVSDRFGEYGLTGLLILERRGDLYRVDTFLLSCRVLGRGVEHRLLAFLGEHAEENGLRRVAIPFVETRKNQPAHDFLESIKCGSRTDDGSYCFRAAEIRGLRWRPQLAVPEEPMPRSTPAAAPRGYVDYERIATELSSASAIVAAIRQQAHASVPQPAGRMLAESEVERRLLGLWIEILQRPDITVNDNFFDLGGHSLLAVLLLMRVKEELGVELSVDDVYSGTLTLRELAQTIEQRQLEGVAPEEYQALLAEIEGLSDEEVHALLEAEESAGSAPEGEARR
jgi:FkbH-like protein